MPHQLRLKFLDRPVSIFQKLNTFGCFKIPKVFRGQDIFGIICLLFERKPNSRQPGPGGCPCFCTNIRDFSLNFERGKLLVVPFPHIESLEVI